MRRNETTTLPIGEAGLPVTLDDAKTHDRIEIAKDDDLVTRMNEAATTSIEGHVNRRYTDRSFELIFDADDVCGNIINLEPYNDLITLTSITSFDEENTGTAVDPLLFNLIGRRIALEEGFFSLDFRQIDTLIIEYSVLKIDASEEIKMAIKELIAHMYENRGLIAIGTIFDVLPGSVIALLQNERTWTV